jgi:hypothetical protein
MSFHVVLTSIGVLAFITASSNAEAESKGFCDLSGNKPEYLNGRYMFSQMFEGFQAFENSAGYKLYGLKSGLVGGRESHQHPPHYWVIHDSWSADFNSAHEVFWVEPDKKTWSRGDDEFSPEFSLCCSLALPTESDCRKRNMHDYDNWLVLKHEPTIANCSLNSTEDCPPSMTEDRSDGVALVTTVVCLALLLVTASTVGVMSYRKYGGKASSGDAVDPEMQSTRHTRGQKSDMGCCNVFCSGHLYRIVPLVACTIAILSTAIFFAAEEEDNHSPVWDLLEFVLFVFFNVDFIIQSCVIRNTKTDCCGGCCCGCGTTLVIKLVIDGIWLFAMYGDIAMSMLLDGEQERAVIIATRPLLFAKFGLEIAALVILHMQENGRCGRLPGAVATTPVVIEQVVVGNPVQTTKSTY